MRNPITSEYCHDHLLAGLAQTSVCLHQNRDKQSGSCE